MKHPDFPRASSYTDRHGKERWRFLPLGSGRPISIPGLPGSSEFDDAYQVAIEGRTVPRLSNVLPLQRSHPHSLRAAYELAKRSDEWAKLDPKGSQHRYQLLIERILATPVSGKLTYGDGPIADLRRQHVKALLKRFGDTPHVERLILICIRKLIMAAIEEEWIAVDPTYGMKRNPHTDGHKTWPAELLTAYEAHWPVGSRQRTAYALALWLGNRISDVAMLKWSHLTTKSIMLGGDLRSVEGFEFVQFKGRKRGKTIFVPITPMLATELAPLSRETNAVLLSERGRAYTNKSLSKMFADWCKEAGLPDGYTAHGLRKALGVKLAESDATTRQLMEALGHNNIAFAELYSREASRLRLAVEAFDKLTTAEVARRRAGFKVVN